MDEVARLGERALALQTRVLRLLRSPNGSTSPCVRQGIEELAARLEAARDEARQFADTGGPPFLTSYELEGSLFDRLDDLGYSLILAEELEVELDTQLSLRVERMLSDLRELVPRLIERLRHANDYFPPDPAQFPVRFWWRRIAPIE